MKLIQALILLSVLFQNPLFSLTSGRGLKSISLGERFACALSHSGRVKCWGQGESGQLGLGDTLDRGGSPEQIGDNLPFVDFGKNVKAAQIASGYHSSCALFDSGDIKCWGNNEIGQLGLGDSNSRGDQLGEMGNDLPFVDLGKNVKAVQISMGYNQVCALLDSGRVKCWGANHSGGLGLGDIIARGNLPGQMGENLPFVDLGKNTKAIQIGSGNSSTCALLDSGKIKCWGDNGCGQLGQGDHQTRGNLPGQMGDNLPFVDLGTNLKAVHLAVGSCRNCAILESGRIKCWGYNNEGELGLGDDVYRGTQPGQMGDNLPYVDLGSDTKAVELTMGWGHTCARLNSGRIKCWGTNGYGQLGLGDNKRRGEKPGQMGNALPFLPFDIPALSISTFASNTCAVLMNQGLKCWGSNTYGELGQGHGDDIGDMPGEMGADLEYTDLGVEFSRN